MRKPEITYNINDYSTDQYQQATDALLTYIKKVLRKTPLAELPETPVRVATVDKLTEDFFQKFGQYPDSVILYYLSNYLLQDYLSSPRKKKTDENQILSWRQQKARYSKEFSMKSMKTLDYIHYKYLFNPAVPKATQEKPDRGGIQF